MISPLLCALLLAPTDTVRPVFASASLGEDSPLVTMVSHAAPPPAAVGHELASAASVGLSFGGLLRAEEAVRAEVRRGAFPGAALAIGRRDKVVVEMGLGFAGWGPAEAEVDPDNTVYDLASLTKVLATTTAVMLLVEDGRMSLDAPVARYLPEFQGPSKGRVTVRHLLTHTSGLPAGSEIWAPTPEGSLARAIAVPLKYAPGARVEYSDIGFIVLWAATERAAGRPLFRMLDERVFSPLGMLSTTFLPGDGCSRCAPTGRLPDGTVLRGRVHDMNARRLGGIAGHAGLFSTAHDLTRFASMLASGGELEGVRVLQEETIRLFTRRQPAAGTRTLGWDTPAANGTGSAGARISPRAFGHTGFTGTSLWIDPDRGTWVVLLANRTYEPRASNGIQALRRTVHDRVAAAVDGAGPATVRAR
ncbi:MAG: serine hydrolase domain-containing protein [Longimicrobiaceae bacterium]